MKRLTLLLAVLLFPCVAFAQEDPQKEPPKVEEVIVVTASRTEQVVHDVPAAVSVLTAEDIEEIPADDYGDLLRNVPGMNVTQISARDIQVVGRGATQSLATTQLVLLDGRTLYLDFFGFVMWDFLPVNTTEIKQIEVVRGPGSAVWGANAMAGVINLITKRPREMEGTSILAGGGELGTVFGGITHAGATDGGFGYKLSASYYEQDPFDRPTGTIPGTTTPYPPFRNEGTEQPKFDLRLDKDTSENSYISFSGGYAGTDGLVHSGIGPFDIESGAALSYAKFDWNKGAFRVGAFANFLDADSTNLLAFGVNGRPIEFAFETKTYNIDLSNTNAIGGRHILTYGANARHNDFDLSIAPLGKERDEYGAFLQDEILLGKARWVIGARVDDLDPIGSVVSPRTAFLLSPTPNHTFRVSYNRAFRAPSLINNYLDTAILTRITLPTGPFIFATRAVGNPNLTEEQMDAYEVGYVGTLQGLIVSLSVYQNKLKDQSDFFAASFYTPANPPANWPLPPAFLAVPPLNQLPSSFTYRNVGEIEDRGVEFALNGRPSSMWSWFFNYSWQDDPDVKGVSASEINVPPTHRANAGLSYDRGVFFVNTNVNYQDDSVWRDVLDARFWGPTDSFTAFNAGVGARFAGERVTVQVTGTNLTDEDIQQHVFGDIIRRKITGQVLFRF